MTEQQTPKMLPPPPATLEFISAVSFISTFMGESTTQAPRCDHPDQKDHVLVGWGGNDLFLLLDMEGQMTLRMEDFECKLKPDDTYRIVGYATCHNITLERF
jgi:hypothetical protein